VPLCDLDSGDNRETRRYPPWMRHALVTDVLALVTATLTGTSALLRLRNGRSHTFPATLLVASAAVFLAALVGLLEAWGTVPVEAAREG